MIWKFLKGTLMEKIRLSIFKEKKVNNKKEAFLTKHDKWIKKRSEKD